MWRLGFICRMPKVTDIFSEYVIIGPFLLQQWLHERAPVLRHAFIASLVNVRSVRI